LDDSLAIAKAINENYAGKPATPLQVAKALNVSPSSGPFRMLCGASIAYGLTKGGCNANEISLEPIVVRIFKPKSEGDDLKAKIEAFLKPKVINDFFTKYDGASIPREDIAKNVLEELGVPSERLDSAFEFMISQGENLGKIKDLKSKIASFFMISNTRPHPGLILIKIYAHHFAFRQTDKIVNELRFVFPYIEKPDLCFCRNIGCDN